MLNRLMQVLPTALLDNLYDAIFPELVRRGNIQFPDDDSCIETDHKGYQIKLRSENDESYTTTWSVHRGEHLICEGENEFYPSVGEAESSAIDWINRYQSSNFVKVNGAN